VDFDRGAALNGEGAERIVAHIPYLTKLADPLVAGALAHPIVSWIQHGLTKPGKLPFLYKVSSLSEPPLGRLCSERSPLRRTSLG
jgi:hypothetical protein